MTEYQSMLYGCMVVIGVYIALTAYAYWRTRSLRPTLITMLVLLLPCGMTMYSNWVEEAKIDDIPPSVRQHTEPPNGWWCGKLEQAKSLKGHTESGKER